MVVGFKRGFGLCDPHFRRRMTRHGHVLSRECASCNASRRCADAATVTRLSSIDNCGMHLSHTAHPRATCHLSSLVCPPPSSHKSIGPRFRTPWRVLLLLLIFSCALLPLALGQKLSDDGLFYCSMPSSNLAVSFCGGDYPSRARRCLPTMNKCDILIRNRC